MSLCFSSNRNDEYLEEEQKKEWKKKGKKREKQKTPSRSRLKASYIMPYSIHILFYNSLLEHFISSELFILSYLYWKAYDSTQISYKSVRQMRGKFTANQQLTSQLFLERSILQPYMLSSPHISWDLKIVLHVILIHSDDFPVIKMYMVRPLVHLVQDVWNVVGWVPLGQNLERTHSIEHEPRLVYSLPLYSVTLSAVCCQS